MYKAVRRKLNSRTGASITFALLLFLVCAVVGSVVLAAGSAAGGRFSELKNMDARYYSVTSAAGLLKETLSGKSVTVTTEDTTVTTTVTTYTDGVPGTPSVTSDVTSGTPTYPGAGAAPRILTDAARSMKAGFIDTDTETYTLTHTPSSGIDAAPLEIAVTRVLSSDGTMKLILRNREGESYVLELTFTCESDRRVDRQTEEGTPTVTASSADDYTVTGEVTLRETTVETYKWTLTEIRKVVAE